MRNRPTYPLQSVDSALRLAQMLQTNGPMRLSDVACELDVGVSTAHRLLSALVYRGFAEQLPDRRYGPGRSLRPVASLDSSVTELRDRSHAAMAELVETVGESANLVVLAGLDVQFVATVECARVLRVGDRAGQRLPAHLTSGGKAILARLPDAELMRFAGLDPVALERLHGEIDVARRDGYASNHQDTERGLTAIGVALDPLPGPISAAICLALPTVRFRRSSIPNYLAALSRAATAIKHRMLITEPVDH
jgi:IclR family transcriptional regulator, acetate operon repressor